jgi:hypothetical protein
VHGSNPGFLHCLAGSRMVDQLFWCEQKRHLSFDPRPFGQFLLFLFDAIYPCNSLWLYMYIYIYSICVCICGSILSNPNCVMPKSFFLLGETPDFGSHRHTVACSQ